ncbi:ankyrin repeat domain-containing protein [Wolbachia endosymbiont (group A) of Cydia splendana]|uniref:ankyrin repeat domain-containing protein n=1 Tax=Wolbachia endosymbiont (group A) of Cydia splendana TaxID=2954000 RepID=UPI0021F83793|nr:ankyrin repeat domain-containing protein [Wolbachia endosymbiont (group A) of Cydia splendana]
MPKATAKTKHIKHKPELIELLLTEPINLGNDKGNPILAVDKEKPVGFAEKFSLFLSETPDIGSTSDPEFFIHGILGSVLILPESGLVEKLGIDKVYVKHTEVGVQDSRKKGKANVVKLCFSLKKDGKKQVALRVFTNDGITGGRNPEDKYRYSDDELKEIAGKLGISDIDNVDEHVFRICTEGEPGNKSFRLHKWQIGRVKEKFKIAASSQSQVNNEFKEISVAQSINLEDSFKELSNGDIKEVIGSTEKIFKEFASVYRDNQEKFSLSNSEAAYHGFHYGALALNFKYRYDLNCYAERTAGNGRADLIFMSRTRKGTNDRMNPKPIPVVVEFKGEGHTADEAIAQIKNKGYLYNLSVRTKAEEAVILGMSCAEVKTEQAKIFQSQGFLQRLLEEMKRFNQNRISEIKNVLKGELKNLYHSIQSHNRHYLSKLVFGQVLAVDDDELDKYIFTYTNQDESIGREATTLVLSNQAKSEAVILNIIERSGEQRALRGKKESDSKRTPPIDGLRINSAVKIDVTINTGVQHKPDGFEVEGEEDKSYYQGINIEKVSGSSQGKFQGQFEKIENVKVGNLVKGLRKSIDIERTSGDKKRSDRKLGESLSPLAEVLFPFKGLIKKEIDFQAIIQGLFINEETEDGKEIRVYMESNASPQGRIDLALSFTQLSENDDSFIEDDPIIIELKLANSDNDANSKLKQAKEQLSEKYKVLRSFTDKKTAKHVAMVFNIRARDKNNVIKVSAQDVKVDHTSSSSPEKKRPGSPLAGCPKRRRVRNVDVLCIDSNDEESIEEKERKEEFMKELFNTDKMRERAKSIEFYDQLFKVSDQMFKEGTIDPSIKEALIVKLKNIDLNSIDPEIRDIVKEMKNNVENKEEIENILRRYGVAEKIGKVAEGAGFAFTMFLVGKHIVNGDIEGLGYDALNLWVMPKIGEKISGKILELGTKLDSQMLKGFAPVMGRAIGNFAAFLGLAESIKAHQSATDPVDIKIADLNIATNSIFIAADVPAVVTETMSAIGMEAGIIGEFAGPVGAAVSVAVIIIAQFVEAGLEVEKLTEQMNLTDQERHDLYWDFFLGKKVPDYIKDDIEAESIYKQYVSKLISQYKNNYDKIVMSLPYILATKEERGDAEIQLFRVYCRTNTKIVDTKFGFGFNTNVTHPFHISDINSRVVPTNIESYSVVCGPRDSDVKVQVDNPSCTDCVVNGIGSGCDSLYDHSNVLLNRTFEKWFLQEYPSDCYNAVIYRNTNSRGYGSMYHILSQDANINVVFQEKDILNGDRDRRDKIENRYYFEKSLDSCKVHNPGRNFFYIAGKFSCDLGADGQKNIVITQGNLTTDSINIHSIVGSNKANHIKVSYADYTDGKGGNDVITAKNFTTIKGYFGDSIYGKGLVLLPINLSDIGNITHTNNITTIYNKSGAFISIDKQILVKTADGSFVTPTKVDNKTGVVTNLHVTKSVGNDVVLDDELDNLRKIDNSNFSITKQLSSANYHSTIGGSSNHIFYPDKEHHNFYWEAPSNISHLYLFDNRNANITIAQANGILDFSQLNCTLSDIQFIGNDKGEIKVNKNDLHVTLLPDYKDVTVTFDGKEYYKFQNGELERDYCSHSFKVDGRFSVNGTDLLNHHNCFTFDSDKVLFLKLNNDLLLLSDRGALSISNYYSFVHKNWDLSIRLNNRIVEPGEFGERADKFSSFRYYKPDEQGLQIYHNQPVNKNDIGLVDLKDKSILNFDMKVMNDILLLSHKNNTLVKVENWNTYQPAKEIMFAFNDAVVSNSKCITSICNPEDVIVEFNKEKVILLKKLVLNVIAKDNFNKAKHLIKSTNFEGGDELRYLYLTIIAIQMCRLHSVITLFNRGYFSIRDKDIHVLRWAIQEGKLDIAKFLIDQGADIESRNAYNERPLHLAVKAGSLDIIKLLFNKGANVNATDMYGQTPLSLAIRRNCRDIVEFLRQAQLDLDRELSNATQDSCSGKIKSLVSRGANINIRNNDRNTPLHLAAKKGYLCMVKELIENGARVDVKNRFDETPLHCAAGEGFSDVVKELIRRGANIAARDGNFYRTPLHLAAKEGRLDVVGKLIENNADINIRNDYGSTPLYKAAEEGYLSTVKKFMENGAHISIKNRYGRTPLDIARDKGHDSVVQYLEGIERERGKPVQRKRRHHHGDHDRHHSHLSHKPLAIDLSNQPEIVARQDVSKNSLQGDDTGYNKEKATSVGNKPSSWINDLFGWVKSSIGGLLGSRAALPEKTFTQSSISQISAPIDVNGTIMLLDLLIRKVTGQKYISTVGQSISPLEAQGYTLNITKEFEKVVEQAGLKSGVSMHRLNIDFVEIQKEVTGKIMSGKFDEISGVLSSYLEKACPGREAGCPGKLSSKKLDKFMVEFNSRLNVVLNQSIQQILHNGDGTLEVDGAKQMSLEPQSYLSNASVHSHSKVSTCLSEIGVTKLGGNINR